MKFPQKIEKNDNGAAIGAEAVSVMIDGNEEYLDEVLSEKIYTQSEWEAEPNKEDVLSKYNNVYITE